MSYLPHMQKPYTTNALNHLSSPSLFTKKSSVPSHTQPQYTFLAPALTHNVPSPCSTEMPQTFSQTWLFQRVLPSPMGTHPCTALPPLPTSLVLSNANFPSWHLTLCFAPSPRCILSLQVGHKSPPLCWACSYLQPWEV